MPTHITLQHISLRVETAFQTISKTSAPFLNKFNFGGDLI